MKRRHFLQGAGILLTGTSGLDREAQASSQNERRILITSGETELAQVIADRLSRDRSVRLTGLTAVPSRFPYTPCQLDHDSATDELVQGVDAIVHVAEPPSGAGEQEQLDHLTRKTYNLLRAAVDAGVDRVLFLSTLELMTGYDEDFLVSERWRPLSTTQPSRTGQTPGRVHLPGVCPGTKAAGDGSSTWQGGQGRGREGASPRSPVGGGSGKWPRPSPAPWMPIFPTTPRGWPVGESFTCSRSSPGPAFRSREPRGLSATGPGSSPEEKFRLNP